MKIALVSPYDFSYPGGVVRHIISLEQYFTRMGHEVKIISPASSPVTGYGDRFIPIGKPRPIPASGSIARITISLNLRNQVKKVLEREKFDIVHLHEPLAPTFGPTVLSASRTVNIGTFHAAESKPSYRWTKAILMKGMYKRWFKKLNGRIAVSPPARDFINKHFPSTFTIIPNGIDLGHFRPDLEPMPQFMDGKFNILFVGRLEKRKGFEYLLKAYRLFKPDLPNCRLIVVGPGTRLRKTFEKDIRKLGIEDVVFAGNVPYRDLPRYYRTADVFCAPATGRESFGIILLEAMATGRPVVASEISGYASVMTQEKEGILVPPKQEVPLAQAITRLLKDEALRSAMGLAGRVTAEKYGWERIGRQVLDFYSEILKSRNQPPRP
jgi:phosphatidyl-myo-inositol alpha-mannosyltransferase